MIICVCKRVNTAQVKEALNEGITDVEGLSDRLGLGTGCGRLCRVHQANDHGRAAKPNYERRGCLELLFRADAPLLSPSCSHPANHKYPTLIPVRFSYAKPSRFPSCVYSYS